MLHCHTFLSSHSKSCQDKEKVMSPPLYELASGSLGIFGFSAFEWLIIWLWTCQYVSVTLCPTQNFYCHSFYILFLTPLFQVVLEFVSTLLTFFQAKSLVFSLSLFLMLSLRCVLLHSSYFQWGFKNLSLLLFLMFSIAFQILYFLTYIQLLC